jgi:hypothetical protein
MNGKGRLITRRVRIQCVTVEKIAPNAIHKSHAGNSDPITSTAGACEQPMSIIRIRDIAAEVPVLLIMVGPSRWLAEWSQRFGRKGLRVRPTPACAQGHLPILPAPKFFVPRLHRADYGLHSDRTGSRHHKTAWPHPREPLQPLAGGRQFSERHKRSRRHFQSDLG